MITYKHGNLLAADVEALVNTVNTVGVMGKGIALQFKQAFPENFRAYEKAAKSKNIQPGKMFVFDTGQLTHPRYIINFPTKRHWREKAHLTDIESGLQHLLAVIQEKRISSIAIPPLGCGFGGLDWEEVRPLITATMEQVPNVEVWLFAPSGAPDADAMQIATSRPQLTVGRAAIIDLIARYSLPGYRLSQLEVQKLAYLLQAAGEPLRLNYVRQQYGPYAENLNFVLQRLDGHYLRGYGDRSERGNLHLTPGAEAEGRQFLQDHPATQENIERVARLIQGFETPYGMELLATVHWLAIEDPAVTTDPEQAISGFENWNARKREHFKPEHIRIAWERLHEQGWI